MKALLALLAILALTLAAFFGLIQMNANTALDLLTPDPENVVQEFVATLATGRYDVARDQLDDELQASMQAPALEAMNHALKAKLGEYDFELGGEEQKGDDQATYLARIKTERAGIQRFKFELQRDAQTRLWEISELNLGLVER